LKEKAMSIALTDARASRPETGIRSWPLERVLFLLAGTVTGLSALLAATVSPWFLLLAAFVSLNQLAFASVLVCGASLILTRLFGFESRIGAR
jgi:sterol desaturase/sphingolipid hydroxylase (fatty acid hydroxylase superfamily)